MQGQLFITLTNGFKIEEADFYATVRSFFRKRNSYPKATQHFAEFSKHMIKLEVYLEMCGETSFFTNRKGSKRLVIALNRRNFYFYAACIDDDGNVVNPVACWDQGIDDNPKEVFWEVQEELKAK